MGDKLKVFTVIFIHHSANCSERSCPGPLSLDLDLDFFSLHTFLGSLIHCTHSSFIHLKFIHSLTSSYSGHKTELPFGQAGK